MELLIEYLKNINKYFNKFKEVYYKSVSEKTLSRKLMKWYKKRTGESFDINNPKTLNEKIQWLKMYDSTQLKADLTDKYKVREYVKERIGEEYLIPLLGVWNRYEEIDFSKLPNRFVLKTNNASGTNIIVKDKNSLDHRLLRLKINRWLDTNFAYKSGFEMHYGLISPKVICEQHMGDNINDYKIFCIHGVPQFIWVDLDRFYVHKRRVFDTKWNRAEFTVGAFDPVDESIEDEALKPKNLRKMLLLARELAKGFCFVRVDLYEIENQVYFGEMTFTPSSGTERFNPGYFDVKYGEMINLPISNKIS